MSSPALPTRIARAEADAHRRYATHAAFGPLVAAHAGPDLPMNAAWHGGGAALTASHLQEFESFCAAHGHRPVIQLLSDEAGDSLPALTAGGYHLSGLVNAYARPLTGLTAPALPPTLKVQEVTDAAAWAATSAQGFGPGSHGVMRVVAGTPGTRLFTATTDGQIAGSAALSVQLGVGALFGMSTLPAARGQGVQAALIGARLHAAHQAGATLASVFASPGSASERNILRAGFTLAAVRLTFTHGPGSSPEARE